MNQIVDLVKDDLVKVNQAIQAELSSDVALINQLGNYIISSGGKRIRPVVALLIRSEERRVGEECRSRGGACS